MKELSSCSKLDLFFFFVFLAKTLLDTESERLYQYEEMEA